MSETKQCYLKLHWFQKASDNVEIISRETA